MADRRMFHVGVVESDSFLDMTPAAQALYFHLGMQADDDGFVNGPRQVCRRCGAQMEQLQELLDGGFLLWFDGVAVIKHFRMANTLQLDRIKQLRYPEIAKQLYMLPNRIYTKEVGKKKDNLFYIRAKTLRELSRKSTRRLESKRNPNRTQSNSTQSNPTQSNLTQSNLTQPNPIPATTVGVGPLDDPQELPAGATPLQELSNTGNPSNRAQSGVLTEQTMCSPVVLAGATPPPTAGTIPSGLGNQRLDKHCARSVSGDSPPLAYDDEGDRSLPSGLGNQRLDKHCARSVSGDSPHDYNNMPSMLLLTEREGLVELTNEQMYHILSVMGYQTTIYYIKKLASFLKEKGGVVKDHYATLLKWWQEDGGK